MRKASPAGREWVGVLCLLAAAGPAQALTITEIMYQPPAGGPDLEYVELYNDSSTVLDLSGYRFASGIELVFPEETLLPGRSYLVVCADVDAVRARYGIQNAVGNFTGRLDPDGERLEVVSDSGVMEVQVSYRDRGKWPSVPRGTGHSLSLLRPYLDPDDGVHWAPSLTLGGTPGRANFPSQNPQVEETVLIEEGDSWSYRKGTAEFSSPRSAWRQVDFVPDAGWLPGRTSIGYGDDDDATVLDDMLNGYPSVAARKSFDLTAAQLEAVETLVLQLRYDDGFIAYLNGTEVARSFLGNTGEDTPFDLPAGLHEADRVLFESFTVSRDALRAGTNVLAVQVHNNQLGSSDLTLGPRLVSQRTLPGGAAGAAVVVLNELFARGAAEPWLELHNRGPVEADISGHHLTDDPSHLTRYTLPPGTVLAPGGFLVVTREECGLALEAPEATLYLSLPDASRVLDARVFENDSALRAGTSDARFPDGGGRWVFSRTPTPGAANRLEVETDLVINEIMYHPFESRPAAGAPFENRPGEYIELLNRGSRVLDLTGYALTRGVDYTFAAVSLGPGEYLVVGEDPEYLRNTYGLTEVHGPWQGGLQNDGETIRLEDPLGNTVNEVTYGEGGDWAELADGKGSSLELIDPLQDNSAGGAWGASDESGKAPWTELSYSGTYTAQQESAFHFTPMDDGSFLLDDVQILRSGVDHVPEGGFEGGLGGWVMQGSLVHSRRTTAEAHTGQACLEVIATAGGDLRVNRLMFLTTPVMASGTYTVKCWARWLHGGNLVLAHGFDNALARTLYLSVPRDLGTPGRENSATAALRAATGSTNLGPIIQGVEQRPAVPAAGAGVTVSASISDADGVEWAQVRWRRGGRGDGTFNALPMTAQGSTWSAVLPPSNLRDKVLFFIEAADGVGAVRTYPADAPAHTLLYQVNSPMVGSLLSYRLVLDEDNRAELETRPLHSDDPVYGTFVFDDSEVYYNVGLHYHGSPWNRPGSPRMFKLLFPGDRPFHGARRFNISRYGSAQNEAIAYYTIGRTGSPDSPTPHCAYRFIRWELNGTDQGVMSHVETVDRQFVDRWWPGDRDGLLLRANGKITFRLDQNWGLTSWAGFSYRGTDKEAYRWNWDLHTRTLEDEWAPLFELMRTLDPATTPSAALFDSQIKRVLDVEEMLRVLAVRVLNDDWDAIGVGNGQNAYLYYAPLEGRWKYLPWDMDHTFASPGATLAPSVDAGVNRLINRPEFRRIYLQVFQSMLARTWNEARLRLVLDPTGAAGVGNGQGIVDFVNARTPSVLAALGAQPPFRIRTNSGRDLVVSTASTNIDGDAPLAVRSILLNGEPLEQLTWTSPTVWRAAVPLVPGENPCEFQGFDEDGVLTSRASILITSTFQWQPPSLSGLEPGEGPEAGGTTVAIHGADFQSGIRVSFGATAAVSVELLSSSELRVVSPPGTGTVEVRVVNVDGRAASLPAAFTYRGARFIRGDVDGNGQPGIADVVSLLNLLFREGTADCLKSADANDDGEVDLSDALRLLLFLYRGGAALPLPYPDAGTDPTPDGLGCANPA